MITERSTEKEIGEEIAKNYHLLYQKTKYQREKIIGRVSSRRQIYETALNNGVCQVCKLNYNLGGNNFSTYCFLLKPTDGKSIFITFITLKLWWKNIGFQYYLTGRSKTTGGLGEETSDEIRKIENHFILRYKERMGDRGISNLKEKYKTDDIGVILLDCLILSKESTINPDYEYQINKLMQESCRNPFLREIFDIPGMENYRKMMDEFSGVLENKENSIIQRTAFGGVMILTFNGEIWVLKTFLTEESLTMTQKAYLYAWGEIRKCYPLIDSLISAS